MENLISEQVKHLADNLLRMTNALGDFRCKNFQHLSEEENLRLKALHYQQLECTTKVHTRSALLVMTDAKGSLEQINTITKETQRLYKNLNDV